MLIIGLMSGTSADGVDAALVDIEGHGRSVRVRLVEFFFHGYSDATHGAILEVCGRSAGVDAVCVLHSALGEQFAQTALAVARRAGVEMRDVAAIASHGQTVWHQPAGAKVAGISARGTLQIGCPAVIAARTGCQVVSDFRSADMAAGGQGAPLVPYFDWAVLTRGEESRAVLNLGGIANVTYLPKTGHLDEVIAFDTGPGNMVIDAIATSYSGVSAMFDMDGSIAARGKWDAALGEELLADPYFALPPPKSTGRELFGRSFADHVLRIADDRELPQEDVLATVTELTARTVANALKRWLPPVDHVIAGGGGCHNKTLMRLLCEKLSPARLSTHDELGIPGDAKEAMAFALLAYETLHGRPSNVPSATGASRPVILGSVTPSP